MNREDEPIDERERREADALARALDRGHADDDLPDDALQTAALIRYAEGAGALSEDRREALLPAILDAAERAANRRADARASPRWRWGFAAIGLVVAVLVIAIVWPRPVAPTALPTPSQQLLRARIDGDEAAFDRAMRDYRVEVLGRMARRYGAR